jgi:hypothetical protein
MVRVVAYQAFSVYVYVETGAPHHLAHCEVRWAGHSSQVSLTTLEVIVGAELPPRARQLVEEHAEEIILEWNRLNPGRPIL